jgi:quercetin dioxygenase-like cupin family protein
MKLFSWLIVGLLVTAGATLAAMQSAPVLFTSDSLRWVAATGPAKGSWNAVMVGNPNSSGTAIIRVKMPDGYTNKPHYHSHAEYITVIQGALLFGTGDIVEKSKARMLPAGSFIAVPAGVHHWSVAQGDTIEQVGGEGPLTNIPVKQSM